MTNKMKSDQNNPKKPKRNSGNFWRNAALIGTLALPLFFSSPKASAQETNASEKQGKNYIYSHDKKVTAAGDGVFGKTFVQNLPLTPKSKISLDSLFYAKQGNVCFDVVRAEKGISNIKNYIVSQGDLTGKEKAFKTHLNSLENFVEKNPSDTKSVKLLNKALEDGTLSVKEDSLYNPKTQEWNIKKGPYIIRAKSNKTDNLKKQTIPILANVSTHYEKTPVVDRKGIESSLYGYNKNNKEQDGKTFIEYDVNSKDDSGEDKKDKEKENKLGLIVQGNYGSEMYGGGVGLKSGNIAGILDFSKAKDKPVKNIKDNPSDLGRYFSGKEENVDYTSIGASLEFHPGNFFFGAGGNLWSYTNKTTEKINSSSGEVLSKNTDSRSKTDLSGKVYGGYNINITDNFDFGIQGGYETKKGPFVGGRFSVDF